MRASAYILLLMVCLAAGGGVLSQPTRPDTSYITEKLELSNQFLDEQPEKAAGYAREAMGRAESINDSASMSRALLLLGIGFENSGNLDSCLYYLGRSADLYR